MKASSIRSSHFTSNPLINSCQTRLSVFASSKSVSSISFPYIFPKITFSSKGDEFLPLNNHCPFLISSESLFPSTTIVATKQPCQPVVCMAYRYAPESTLRKKKARKRGGDPRKKRKAKRKSKRSKKSTKVVFLVSTAKTGFSYAKRKSVEFRDKLKIRKYDPVVNRHVPFQE